MDAVILCGGEATRLRPITYALPKPMIPVAGRPFLAHLVERLRVAGIDDITVIVSPRSKRHIEKYFGDTLNYAIQRHPKGTADALKYSEEYIRSNVFLVLNGDNLFSLQDLSEFVKNILMMKKSGIAVYKVDNPENYGVVLEHRGILRDIIEKPEKPPSSYINAGLYALPVEIFPILHELMPSSRGEYELTDAIIQLSRIIDVHIYKLKNAWLDLGYPWHILSVNSTLMRDEGKYVYIHQSADIGDNSQIDPRSEVMDNVEIGENTVITNSIIMSGARVGNNCVIRNSIIGPEAEIGNCVITLDYSNRGVVTCVKGQLINSGRFIMGSVVGPRCSVRDNTILKPGEVRAIEK